MTAASLVEMGNTSRSRLVHRQTACTPISIRPRPGVVIELLEHFGGSPRLSAPPFPANVGIGTDRVSQLHHRPGHREDVQRYVDVLSLPKPPIMETAGYAKSKTTYQGQPSEATAKLAFFPLGSSRWN